MTTLDRRQTLLMVLFGVFLGNALLAEIIGGKLFQVATPWHTFTLSAGIVLWPVVFVFTDIINEYYGRAGVRAVSLLTAAIIAYAFVALTAAGQVPAASFSPVDDTSFGVVFFQSRWIIVGSICAFLLAQLLDVTVFWALRRVTGGGRLWLRATGSTLVSQLVDTFVVGFVGLHLPHLLGQGGITFGQFIDASVSGYLFKVLIALGVTPVLYLVHNAVDRYLGEEKSAELMSAAAEASEASSPR